MFGLPMDVLHAFVGRSATLRVKACSLVPMVNANGRAETVTMFNDLVDLVDFVSDDRLRASQTARRFHPPGMVQPSIQDHRREPDDNTGEVTLHTGVSRKPPTSSWLYR